MSWIFYLMFPVVAALSVIATRAVMRYANLTQSSLPEDDSTESGLTLHHYCRDCREDVRTGQLSGGGLICLQCMGEDVVVYKEDDDFTERRKRGIRE